MKLLFDQNLSPRLPHLLADLYAESAHVREVGLREATDLTIWQFAQANGYVIVSKTLTSSNAVYSKVHHQSSFGCE
jgi:predicted nuclease of predicted toxin-antitoxin system